MKSDTELVMWIPKYLTWDTQCIWGGGTLEELVKLVSQKRENYRLMPGPT